MPRSPFISFAVLMLIVVSGAAAQAERSVTSYVYVRNGNVDSDRYDYREVIVFFPDGLMHTTKVTRFDREKHAAHAEGNYLIIREANNIREISLDTTGAARADSYEIDGDGVLAQISRSRGTHAFTVRRRQSLPTDSVVYERVDGGIVVHEYTFTPDRLVIRDVPIKRTLTCAMDPKTGLPVMTSTYERSIGSDITFGRTKSGDIYAIYRDADGPLLASYRFEGKPFHASPLITVINCEIGLDWLHGVLLPFIGGAPAE